MNVFKTRKNLLIVKSILIGLIFLIIWVFFVGEKVDVSFSSGGEAHIKTASFFGSLLGSKCRISYTNGSNSGDVLLFDGRPEGPIILIPSNDSKIFYCLYDFDVELRLLKVETNVKFHPFPTNSSLSYVVLSSPWKISDANDSDWRVADQYLTALPQSRFKELSMCCPNFLLAEKKESLLSKMEWQLSRPN